MAERAGRAGIISPYGMHDSEARREKAAGTAAEDPRSCAEMRQGPDSGAECRKQESGVLLGARFGRWRGGGRLCLSAFSAQPTGRTRSRTSAWGRPSEPQTSNFNIRSGIDGSGDVDLV